MDMDPGQECSSTDPDTSELGLPKTESIPTLYLDDCGSMEDAVEVHLESINKAIDEINSLSQDFLIARDEFIRVYEDAKSTLKKTYNANKRTVDRARPFYVARDAAYRAKYEHRRSTARLKKSEDDLQTAKDVARKVEEGLLTSASAGSGGTTDPDVLSNLNKANDDVVEAGRTLLMARHDQGLCMSELSKADDRLAASAQRLSQHVLKASSYFDLRDKLQRKLDADYYRLWEKSKKVQDAKLQHRDMFQQFSAISTQFSAVRGDEEYSTKPPDLSQFEEIDDVDSLDSSFHELESSFSSRCSYNNEAVSLHSNGSVSEANISHVTTRARSMSPEELADFNMSERQDNEIFIDYGVTFQMDI